MATKYAVAVGDTYPQLARHFYGETALAVALAAANRMHEDDPLIAGQELVVPYITQRHTVAAEDSLPELAEMYYGDGTMFPVLASANHVPAPHVIRCGDTLLVPDLFDVSRHTVYPGDTLREFAVRWYNDDVCDLMIACANHLAGQGDIEVGQVLVRPGLNRRHTIEGGETWSQLGQAWYGDPTLDRMIATANRFSIDEVPPVGRVLFFPDLADY
jgi:nucleoid-associated protein YgaU